MVRDRVGRRPAGSMLSRRLPLTRRISLTCMVDLLASFRRILFSAMIAKGTKGGARHRRRAGHRPGDARRCSPRAATGWRWPILARRRPQPPFFFQRTDVAREAAVRACVRAVVKRFGRLDALVNNAGIADPADGPIEKLPLARVEPPHRASTSPAPS